MNTKYFLRFTGNFTLYLFIIIALAAFPIYKLAEGPVLVGLIINTLLFYVVTLISFFLIVWTSQKKGKMVNAFLAGTVLKILLSLIYLLTFLKSFPHHEVEFVVTFFAAYLICTGFEVYYILYNLREI